MPTTRPRHLLLGFRVGAGRGNELRYGIADSDNPHFGHVPAGSHRPDSRRRPLAMLGPVGPAGPQSEAGSSDVVAHVAAVPAVEHIERVRLVRRIFRPATVDGAEVRCLQAGFPAPARWCGRHRRARALHSRRLTRRTTARSCWGAIKGQVFKIAFKASRRVANWNIGDVPTSWFDEALQAHSPRVPRGSLRARATIAGLMVTGCGFGSRCQSGATARSEDDRQPLAARRRGRESRYPWNARHP